MQNILIEHMEHYPEMEIRDLFKLIYQSEFGGGHMITDKKKSLEWIKKEYEWLQSQRHPLREGICEDIGGDMCRIYLDALKMGLSEETLNAMFVLSANAKIGTVDGLEKKLECLLELCRKGEVSFPYTEVKEAIGNWKAQGYPAIHHSETFRDKYLPAYRVVMKKYAERMEVFQKIDYYLKNAGMEKETAVIAIEGMAGAGKSVLGQLLSEIYSCNLFHMDDFFLQPHQRTSERFEEPGGNVDYERFKVEVIDKLNNRDGFCYQKYDCSTQSLGEEVEVSYSNINIVEGAYSLHPYFGDYADITFFLEVSEEVQYERIRQRNGEWMLKRFVEEWIPMEHKYFEKLKIREKATRI